MSGDLQNGPAARTNVITFSSSGTYVPTPGLTKLESV
jgi:hypothetical protein